MSNLKLKATPKSFEDASAVLGKRDEVVIGYATKLERLNDGNVYATHHGNLIVRYEATGDVFASWAGWASPTTTNRLNKLAPGSFRIQQREPNLNGVTVSSLGWHKVS